MVFVGKPFETGLASGDVLISATHLITWFQAVVLGLLQGVTELFPISSLGHTVLLPTLLGWHNVVAWQSQPQSPWLAFLVMLHVGSAIGLLAYFWRDWVRIVQGFFASLRKRRIETPDERLAWLVIVATIPVGVLGLLLERPLRTLFARPLAAAIFLTVNGLILLGGEHLRKRAEVRELALKEGLNPSGARELDTLDFREAGVIGTCQSAALIAGISRDGVVMTGGLLRGLNHSDAAKFGFYLATPPILAAGLLKIGDVTGPLGDGGVRSAALVAAIFAAVASVATVHFLSRYFTRGNLRPFGIYCLLAGSGMTAYTALGG